MSDIEEIQNTMADLDVAINRQKAELDRLRGIVIELVGALEYAEKELRHVGTHNADIAIGKIRTAYNKILPF